MSEIWVLSKGEYSDYHVDHVVGTMPDEETAKRIAEELGYEYRAETLQVFEDPRVVEVLTINWHCTQDAETIGEHEYTSKVLVGERYTKADECDSEYTFRPASGNPGSKRYRAARGYLTVSGYNHERVRKVFSEKKARIIADEVYRRMPNS